MTGREIELGGHWGSKNSEYDRCSPISTNICLFIISSTSFSVFYSPFFSWKNIPRCFTSYFLYICFNNFSFLWHPSSVTSFNGLNNNIKKAFTNKVWILIKRLSPWFLSPHQSSNIVLKKVTSLHDAFIRLNLQEHIVISYNHMCPFNLTHIFPLQSKSCSYKSKMYVTKEHSIFPN